MTTLTNLSPAASYGDIITTTNNGQGLSANLNQIQDGLGNNAPMLMSTTQINFTGTTNFVGAIQVGGTALTATATQINNVVVSGTFAGINANTAVQLPLIPTASLPAAGSGNICYDSSTNQLKVSINGVWRVVNVT